MPHDSNGILVKAGDRVLVRGVVRDVTPNETACNATVVVDAPDGEYHPVVALNTKSLEVDLA